MRCLNGCGTDVGSILRGDAFCSGACKHEYRSGQDPTLCAHCQDRPRSESKLYTGYCSLRCMRVHG